MKKIFTFAAGLLFITGYSQTTVLPSGLANLTTENYVFSRTYLEPLQSSSATAKQVQSVSYFDGLGRPKQSVTIKASPTGKDLVTTIPYDDFGRQVDSWLPVPMTSLSGGMQIGVESSATTYYNNLTGDSHPFSHQVVEKSPLDRIQNQIQVGDAWQGKPVSFGYEANGADEVYKYFTTTTWQADATLSVLRLAQATDLNSSNNCYKANQLYKNIVTDEDGNTTVEFKNGAGQTLLVRKNDGVKNVDTYYVYNGFNQLAYVIPPLAVGQLFPLPTGPVDTVILTDFCYQYRYDGRGRLVEKKLPGKGWEYMVYDNQDRLVMIQDANMGADKRWLFTKYDQFGRVAYTGIYESTQPYTGAGRNTEQGNVKGKGSNNVARTTTGNAYGSGVTLLYDNLTANNYPNTITDLLSINYYDTYPPGSPAVPSTILTQAVLQQNAQTSNRSTKSLPTASFVKNIENSAWTKNYTWYDMKGRPIGSQSINHLGGYTKTETELDFAGMPQKTFTYHSRVNTIIPDVTIKERFVYNQFNQALEKHYHEVVGKSPEELLTENTYNEIGQLITKKVGNNIQEMDYAYNIRGWMTAINDGDILSNPAEESYTLINGKLFGYKIKYNNPENPSLAPARYNGNIAEIDWIDIDSSLKRYGYQYDQLNRLLAGNYQDPGLSLPETHINDEILTYDLNGNIATLVRKSKQGKHYTPTIVDNLSYQYTGNRLTSINDATTNASGYPGGGQTITYDPNGNMTAMPDKGIAAITYNFLNLPTQINQNTNTTKYLYRADGVKLKKTYNLVNAAGSKIINTEYLDGFQYSTPNTEPIRRALQETDDATLSAVTAGNEEAFSALEGRLLVVAPENPQADNVLLSFFPTAEGYYDFENFRYIYQYKDHLGNVRISFLKNSAGDLQIMDRNEFYPFGLSFLKNNSDSYFDPLSIPYNYKYNGKELQETGMYDYGARMYMPDIGRWGVVDKLSEKYPFASNYAYVLNRPTVAVDPDGKRVYFIGGAGNDQDGWDYVNRWARAFASNGINDFYRVNATRGSTDDIGFTVGYRNTGYEQVMSSPNMSSYVGGLSPSMTATNEQRPVQDDMIDTTVNAYQDQLKNNPLKEGEQFNLVGYSYGSVLQAQSALRLADSGQVIDNLVLIGSPISDKSDLMKQLQGNKNIKNVTRYDIKGDLLSNPKDILQFIQGGYETKKQGDDAPHYDAARPGQQADQLMQVIVQWLQQQGVKN